MACYPDDGMQAAVVARASCSFRSVDVTYCVLLCFALSVLWCSKLAFPLAPSALLLGFPLTPWTRPTHKISFTALVPLLRHRDFQRGCQPALCRSQPINNGTWTSPFSALLFTHPAISWRYADWILAAWLCPETGIFC